MTPLGRIIDARVEGAVLRMSIVPAAGVSVAEIEAMLQRACDLALQTHLEDLDDEILNGPKP